MNDLFCLHIVITMHICICFTYTCNVLVSSHICTIIKLLFKGKNIITINFHETKLIWNFFLKKLPSSLKKMRAISSFLKITNDIVTKKSFFLTAMGMRRKWWKLVGARHKWSKHVEADAK